MAKVRAGRRGSSPVVLRLLVESCGLLVSIREPTAFNPQAATHRGAVLRRLFVNGWELMVAEILTSEAVARPVSVIRLRIGS